MAIIIKEIEVKTIVEKKIIQDIEIPKSVYTKITNAVISKLNKSQPKPANEKKRER